jgi:hypothetical protein
MINNPKAQQALIMHRNGPRPCLLFTSKVCGAFLAAFVSRLLSKLAVLFYETFLRIVFVFLLFLRA